jgi:hypothetical protein
MASRNLASTMVRGDGESRYFGWHRNFSCWQQDRFQRHLWRSAFHTILPTDSHQSGYDGPEMGSLFRSCIQPIPRYRRRSILLCSSAFFARARSAVRNYGQNETCTKNHLVLLSALRRISLQRSPALSGDEASRDQTKEICGGCHATGCATSVSVGGLTG